VAGEKLCSKLFFLFPAMSQTLDSATPGRPPKVPFLGQERYVFMFLCEKNCACGHPLRRLCDAGLKINAARLTFCALEIEYLGYVLTRDGIKPQSNKVQAILAIKPPTGVKQLRNFLGMVQYITVTSGQDGAICLPLPPH
jgi:hypothetical protein